jgi:RecB family endonuclease NucS
MVIKSALEDILCKYPELIEPGFSVKGRHVELYGQDVDILLVDKFGKRLAVQVRVSPIEKEHVGAMISHQEKILSGEAPDITVMMVSDKIPPRLQTTLEHNGVSWKEITTSQIEEHLSSRNDTTLLKKMRP